MSFPKYPKYKDSGVEWLGEVPEHWEVKPLKAATTHNDEVLDETTNPDMEIFYVDISSVDSVNGIGNKERMFFSAAPSRARRLVRHGDVIISTVRTYLRAIAKIKDPEENLVVSTGFVVIRPTSKVMSDFLGYLVFACFFVEQVIARSTGVSYPAINASDLVAIPVTVPPPVEQTAIASFLDRETAKIDELVAEQRRLIELLTEKRQAVISHAVTKGLNPHAPMKPSGIEWLGDVPEHWLVGKCGFHLAILSGFAFPSSEFSHDDDNVKLLRGINVGVGRLKWDETVFWRRNNKDGLDDYELQAGNIVIGMDRPLIADGVRVAKVKESDLPCLLLQRVASIKPHSTLNPDFFLALISSEMFVAHFYPETTGVSVPHISPEQISSFIIPVPPVTEQAEIAEYIGVVTTRYVDLVTEAQRAIDLLQEPVSYTHLTLPTKA